MEDLRQPALVIDAPRPISPHEIAEQPRAEASRFLGPALEVGGRHLGPATVTRTGPGVLEAVLGQGHHDVAGAYINLRDLDRQLEIARSTAKSRGESYEIFKLRFDGGIISVLERVPLDQKRTLYVVKAGDEVLLLGASDLSVNFLSKLDAKAVEEAAKPAGQVTLSPFLQKLLGKKDAPPPPPAT